MPSAPLTMSRVRIRVDSRLWWASRMVVSVSSSFFCPSTQFFTASGPSASKSCLRPGPSGSLASGKRGMSYWWRSASGLATWISEIYRRTRVARSRESMISNSSGVSSINLVWHWPLTNTGCARILVTKGILVLTPRTRTSLMARADLRQAAAKVRSQLVTFTSSES